MAITFLLFLFLAAGHVRGEAAQECLSRDYDLGGTVCVCNAEHCDTVPKLIKIEQPEYLIYTSNKAGLRFKQETGVFTETENPNNQIVINSEQTYQSILGWGGAFTDATGINVASLDEGLQEALLKSYFSEDGIEYNLCRVPIGGTDFSTHGYSYDDGEADAELINWALAEEDHLYKIPYILKASELTGNKLELFSSAWTAPKWMKTNGEYNGYGFLFREYYQTWADYYVKFLDAYKEEGISFWGITTGNEPFTAQEGVLINAVGWNASDMGGWIIDNLGPALRGSDHSDITLMILDDNRDHLPFVYEALTDEAADAYIDGIATHWYADMGTSTDFLVDAHEHYPQKFILYTEASFLNYFEGMDAPPVVLGSWSRGERVSADMIDVLKNWVTGWVDWNMALDVSGGPVYAHTLLDSPIIVNATAGEFYKQPMFYHFGHFSKFIPKDSIRVDSSYDLDPEVAVVAFQRPDGGVAVVLLNQGEEAVTVSIVDGTRGTAEVELSEKSITTIVYW